MNKGIKLILFNSKFQNQRKSLAPGLTGGASIFDRPGIGSMAFRNSVSASLFSFNNNNNEANKDNSIGSAGSLAAEEEDIDGKVISGFGVPNSPIKENLLKRLFSSKLMK